jgi:hypothetical protein
MVQGFGSGHGQGSSSTFSQFREVRPTIGASISTSASTSASSGMIKSSMGKYASSPEYTQGAKVPMDLVGMKIPLPMPIKDLNRVYPNSNDVQPRLEYESQGYMSDEEVAQWTGEIHRVHRHFPEFYASWLHPDERVKFKQEMRRL